MSTPLRAAALTSLTLIAVSAFAANKSKEYENFDLPQAKSSSVPEGGSAPYMGSKVQLSGRTVRVKEASFNAQAFVFAKEAFLAEKRDEAIKLLRQELDSGMKRNRDNLLLRLGQLYAEKYMELSYRENELFTAQLQQFEKAKLAKKEARPPKLDNSRSQNYLGQALGLFQSLEKEFPNHPKIDEVLFFIGFVQMETGKTETGMRYLERVVRQYPKSRKYEEAVVYLGDHYFEKIKFREALARYKILTVRKESPLYHYALYKIAWCELNTGEAPKGLRNMKELVEDLKGVKETSKFNLREQALKDLVVFYGESGQVEEAIAYFTDNQSKDKALENLRLIADILRSKARDDAAVKAYTRLVNEFPNTPETPRLYLGLFECQSRLGRSDAAVKTLITALETFHPGSAWTKEFPTEKQDEVKSNIDHLAGEAEKIAFYFHSSAQKSSNKGNLNNALSIYKSLIANFPNHPEKKKLAFYTAEIYYAEGKWLDAANSYMVAAQIPPKDKMADEGVYNALLALDRLTAKNDSLDRYSKEDQKNVDLKPQDIPTNEKRFIEVAEYYLKEYPEGSRVVDVRFRVAAIYYKYHHFDVAQTRFKEIALKYPFHKSATTSANIVLDIYNVKKDYAGLDATAKLFAKTDRLGDAAFKAEMAQLSGEIEFKGIEQLEANNKWKEAGQTYYEYYKRNTKGPLAEKSLYNAYVSFEKANDTMLASETSRIFIANFPKSEYTKRFTLNLARLAEKRYDFDDAQKQYAEFAKKFPTDKEARKALYNAAVFAELLEKNQTALELYDDYLKGQVSAEEKKAITISQAKLYRKSGNWDKMTAVYRRLIRDSANTNDRLQWLGELARAYEKGGKVAERTALLKEIKVVADGAKGTKLSGPVVAYLAEMKFRDITKQRENYEKIQLRFPVEDFLYTLSRKQKALAKLATAYDAVVEVGVPDWGVAALFEKSAAFDNFVEGFRRVQIPARYKGEERAEVEKQLKQLDANLVKPLESKSKDFLKACASKSAEFYVANEYAAKCRTRADKSLALIEPSGVLPQPSYWTTRWTGQEVAKK